MHIFYAGNWTYQSERLLPTQKYIESKHDIERVQKHVVYIIPKGGGQWKKCLIEKSIFYLQKLFRTSLGPQKHVFTCSGVFLTYSYSYSYWDSFESAQRAPILSNKEQE